MTQKDSEAFIGACSPRGRHRDSQDQAPLAWLPEHSLPAFLLPQNYLGQEEENRLICFLSTPLPHHPPPSASIKL